LTKLKPAIWAGPRRLLWLGLLICLTVGCYSSDYRRQTAATASMLGDLAQKLGDYCRADFKLDHRQVSSEEMGEFYYALRKARSYASEASSDSGRQSYQGLTRLIDDYATLLGDVDRYRLAANPDPQRLAEIIAAEQRVWGEAQTVVADLKAGD
jgi:hypothetical protein